MPGAESNLLSESCERLEELWDALAVRGAGFNVVSAVFGSIGFGGLNRDSPVEVAFISNEDEPEIGDDALNFVAPGFEVGKGLGIGNVENEGSGPAAFVEAGAHNGETFLPGHIPNGEFNGMIGKLDDLGLKIHPDGHDARTGELAFAIATNEGSLSNRTISGNNNFESGHHDCNHKPGLVIPDSEAGRVVRCISVFVRSQCGCTGGGEAVGMEWLNENFKVTLKA